MIQEILAIILFIIAGFYLGKMMYKEFSGKGNHCNNCAVRDWNTKP